MEQTDFTISTYKQNISEGKLVAGRCEKCDVLYLPPRPVCPQCHGTDMGWQELSGKGKVVGVYVYHHRPDGHGCKGIRGGTNRTGRRLSRRKKGPASRRCWRASTLRTRARVSVGMPVVAGFNQEGEGEDASVSLVFRPA